MSWSTVFAFFLSLIIVSLFSYWNGQCEDYTGKMIHLTSLWIGKNYIFLMFLYLPGSMADWVWIVCLCLDKLTHHFLVY